MEKRLTLIENLLLLAGATIFWAAPSPWKYVALPLFGGGLVLAGIQLLRNLRALKQAKLDVAEAHRRVEEIERENRRKEI